MIVNLVVVIGYYLALKPKVIEQSLIQHNKVIFTRDSDNFIIQIINPVLLVAVPPNVTSTHAAENEKTNSNIINSTNSPASITANPENNIIKPKIAIIVVNAGLSQNSSEMINELSPKVAIGISPYANDIKYWEEKFTLKQHDIYTNVPLESTSSQIDNGFLTLLTYNTLAANLENLKQIRDKFTKLKGIYIFGSENFTASDQIVEIFKEMNKNNLSILYLNQNLPTYTKQAFNDNKINYLTNAILIDEFLSNASIEDKLNQVRDLAKDQGYAIATLRPYPISINLIAKWLDQLSNDGTVELVRINELSKYSDKSK